MPSPLPDSATRKHSRRAANRTPIAWGAVAALAVDWVAAISEYLFSVLLVGLVGGYFGTMVDGLLYVASEELSGVGRQSGWVIGALAAAIGLPLGSVKVNGKTFSFPTPRKLRQKVASKRRSRAQQKFHSRSITDVLKGSLQVGVIGAFLGLALGLCLLICWFSLAMSPFSPAGWIGAIEFVAEDPLEASKISRPRNSDGGAMTTDHPIAVYAMCGPILVLGLTGATFGLIYGSVDYVRYLLTVPAHVRAMQKTRRRKPVVSPQAAAQAAIEEDLPQLAPAPRAVPWRARWQLLRQGSDVGLAVGGMFAGVGAGLSLMIVLMWLNDDQKIPLIGALFPLIFVAFGLVWAGDSFRSWRARIDVLRRGYLAHCQITKCRDGASAAWIDFEKAHTRLHRAWHQPVMTGSDSRFLRRLIWLAIAFVVVFGCTFVAITLTFIYHTWHAGWVVAAPVAILLTGGLLLLLLLRSLRRIAVGPLVPARWGLKALVTSRVEFRLPDGKVKRAEARLDFRPRLQSAVARREDLVVYHPLKPSRALLLSAFRPPLEVGDNGQWQFAHDASKIGEVP